MVRTDCPHRSFTRNEAATCLHLQSRLISGNCSWKTFLVRKLATSSGYIEVIGGPATGALHSWASPLEEALRHFDWYTVVNTLTYLMDHPPACDEIPLSFQHLYISSSARFFSTLLTYVCLKHLSSLYIISAYLCTYWRLVYIQNVN